METGRGSAGSEGEGATTAQAAGTHLRVLEHAAAVDEALRSRRDVGGLGHDALEVEDGELGFGKRDCVSRRKEGRLFIISKESTKDLSKIPSSPCPVKGPSGECRARPGAVRLEEG